MIRIQEIDHFLEFFDEGARIPPPPAIIGPIGGVHILDHIDAARRDPVVEKVKTGRDMLHVMATIVQDDVGDAKLVQNPLKEFWVGLPTNPNRNLLVRKLFAHRINVDRHDLRDLAQPTLPHLGGAAISSAYFKKSDRLSDISAEMPLIGKEVMPRFVNGPANITQKNIIVLCLIRLVQAVGRAWRGSMRRRPSRQRAWTWRCVRRDSG